MFQELSGESEYFYAACLPCTAKWYSRHKSLCCPRCGSAVEAIAAEPPPWLPMDRVEAVPKKVVGDVVRAASLSN